MSDAVTIVDDLGRTWEIDVMARCTAEALAEVAKANARTRDPPP